MRGFRAATGLGLVSLLWTGCGTREPPPTAAVPLIDHTGFESQIVTKIEQARSALQAARDSAEVWGGLGQVLHAHDLHDDALLCYEQAMTLAPGDYRWPYLAALAAGTDLAASLRYFEQAARSRPNNSAFFSRYGDVLLQSGRPGLAADQYRRTLEQNPRSAPALTGLAQVALLDGDDDLALEHLVELSRIAPNQGEAHLLMAQIHQRKGQLERARESQRRSRRARPAPSLYDPVVDAMLAQAVSSHAWAERGILLTQQGRLAEAERMFRAVMQLRRPHASDYANLGGALARQGKLVEAVQVLEAGLLATPDDVNLLNNLGMALFQKSDRAAAVERLESAMAIDPDYAGARFNLALILSRTGKPADALPYYEEALRLDPAFAEAHTNYGVALSELGRSAEAIEQWSQSIEINAGDTLAAYHLARALAQQGRRAQAIEVLEGALQVASGSTRLAALLAEYEADPSEPSVP